MIIFIVECLHMTKKVTIIPLGNNIYAIKKNQTDSSLTSLRIETRKIHNKSLLHFQSNEKEYSP